MKKHSILLLLLFVSSLSFAQKKEKIKGSKIVTVEQREIGNFDAIEVSDNIEVFLDRSEKSALKIEADDNLHSIINVDLIGNTLRISTSQRAYRHKKLIARISYTTDLKTITAKEDSKLNAIQEIQLNEITVKAQDNAVLNLNVNTPNFTFQADDKSKTELNLKAENASFILSKKAELKSLVSTTNFKCDLYEKSEANIEGSSADAKIRLDNNTEFTGKNFVVKNIDLITESYSKSSVNSNTTIAIDATGNASIQLYGDPKIEIKRFADNASIDKKPSK